MKASRFKLRRTCSPRSEGELLAKVGVAVVVLAGDPRPVVRRRPQVGEYVPAAEEVVPVRPRSHPNLLGEGVRPAVQALRQLQLERRDGGDALGDPLQGVARLVLAVQRGLDVGRAGKTCG